MTNINIQQIWHVHVYIRNSIRIGAYVCTALETATKILDLTLADAFVDTVQVVKLSTVGGYPPKIDRTTYVKNGKDWAVIEASEFEADGVLRVE